jgi:nicotinate-nucleotide adenylyltransferase
VTGRRVGLLGGAFNPPHDGHLKLARLALDHLELDELRFVPTSRSPHKPDPGGPDAFTRLRLLEALLVEAGDACRIETLELIRGGTSYTVDTLEDLAVREPGTAWILIMGSDQLAGLPTWRRADRIIQLASVAVAPRPGMPAELPAGAGLRAVVAWSGEPGECVWLPPTDLDLASSTLRARLAADGGADPGGLAPEVLAAIRLDNLYR